MKKKIITGMLLAISLFITACSSNENSEAEEKILKVAVSEDTTTLETDTVMMTMLKISYSKFMIL
ncbi:hypothetical protein [Anaerococcus cruorum]|uniref:Uncharacterized protein n=1 Tax=Anaerococcus cruorum TaxID=3115617 RepID=A0ABW9MVS4_9FIRM